MLATDLALPTLLVMQGDDLIFYETPTVEFGGNFFHNVPIILRYNGSALIEVISEQEAGFTTRFSIYNKDGVDLGRVVGARLVLTVDGRKSGLVLEHPDRMTVCKLNGQTLFEVRRTEAAALKTSAELYAHDGAFLRVNSNGLPGEIVRHAESLRIGGTVFISGSKFVNCAVGIDIRDGSISLG